MAGQQGSRTDWSNEAQAAAAIKAIPGLAAHEAAELTTSVNAAIRNENDLTKKELLIGKVKGLVEGAVSGGVKGLFSAALGAITG
jgi:hypothetical protein